MRESRPPGFVRGALSNECPYRDPDHKLIALIVILAAALPAWRQTLQPVTTRTFDNSRSGANTHETILTRDNVVARGIRRVTIIPVFGDARGTESQPLILSV